MRRPGLTRFKITALIAVLCSAAFAAGRYQELELFSKALSLVQNQYFRPVEEKRLIHGAIKGMLSELDPHSSFFTPKESESFLHGAKGYSSVLGFSLERRAGGFYILSVLEGSSAQAAGLQRGDKIIALNGKAMAAIKEEGFFQKLQAREAHTLLIERKGRRFVKRLKKKLTQLNSASAEALEEGYLSLRIHQFPLNGFAEVKAALMAAAASNGLLMDLKGGAVKSAQKAAAKKQPLKGLLIDLRGNPGGSFEQAVKIADLFLSKGIISIYRQRGKKDHAFLARQAPTLGDFPIVILIDEHSASAAEALTAALKENQKALVAGRLSFGKGAVQSFFQLPRGHALKLTSGEYRSPSGQAIHGQGVMPHILLPLQGEAGKELARSLKKAPLKLSQTGKLKLAKKQACARAASASLESANYDSAEDIEKAKAFQILKSFHALKSACFSAKIQGRKKTAGRL